LISSIRRDQVGKVELVGPKIAANARRQVEIRRYRLAGDGVKQSADKIREQMERREWVWPCHLRHEIGHLGRRDASNRRIIRGAITSPSRRMLRRIARQRNLENVSHCEFSLTKHVEKHGLKGFFV